MYNYEIKLSGNQNFSKEELLLLLNESFLDGILCVRGDENESVMIHTNQLNIDIIFQNKNG